MIVEKTKLRADADIIIKKAIEASLPDTAVKERLAGMTFPGRVFLISVGKAAWVMAEAALDALGNRVTQGLVVTKYGHSRGELPNTRIIEAGHPVPDENSVIGADAALELAAGLNDTDTVLFLLSGGGSALFEKPLVPLQELRKLTDELLRSGADIEEINTVRKRLSAVKGGRFAAACAPAKVISLILSDVLGSEPGSIASGPTSADRSLRGDALRVCGKYSLKLSREAMALMESGTLSELPNSEIHIIGSVELLCRAAEQSCRELGYETQVLTASETGEAREAGEKIAYLVRDNASSGRKLAFISGGETVVHVKGKGLGGRNQELVLASVPILAGIENAALFSIGSDGTDGPTDAAGAYADGETMKKLKAAGTDPFAALADNDSYHAFESIGALIKTGPTGTNVNDLTVGLIG